MDPESGLGWLYQYGCICRECGLLQSDVRALSQKVSLLSPKESYEQEVRLPLYPAVAVMQSVPSHIRLTLTCVWQLEYNQTVAELGIMSKKMSQHEAQDHGGMRLIYNQPTASPEPY